jgi:dTDP-glucose 4,6-dehydratase
MKLAITGGAGFIGSNFTRRVVDQSLPGITELVVIDKLTYAGTLSNFSKEQLSSFRFLQGDICDSEFILNSLRGVDAVINFAAESHVDRSIKSAHEFVATNIQGTQNLLDSCRNLEINNFVQVSTDEVYGSISEGSWTESEPLLPNSPYAASKASADLLVRAASRTHGMNTRITRCSNNYGSNQFPEKVIPLFVTNLIEGKKVPIYGEGLNVRDWLHVDDHCRGIHLALMKGKPGEIYNIGGGRELSNLELTNTILELMNKSSSDIEYVSDRVGHDQRYSVDYTKIQSELGYSPKIKFEDGIESTIQWYLKNEAWWKPLKARGKF